MLSVTPSWFLATTTYNAGIYPFMNDFITRLAEHNFQNRTVGLIENGSWAPLAAKVMKEMLSKCKKINWLNTTVKIMSAVNEENRRQMEAMADELCKEYIAKSDDLANKNDMTALFRIGYGLYVVTSNDGKKDNGLDRQYRYTAYRQPIFAWLSTSTRQTTLTT